jgi:hypothetical protein
VRRVAEADQSVIYIKGDHWTLDGFEIVGGSHRLRRVRGDDGERSGVVPEAIAGGEPGGAAGDAG